jgi:hypothetical protein
MSYWLVVRQVSVEVYLDTETEIRGCHTLGFKICSTENATLAYPYNSLSLLHSFLHSVRTFSSILNFRVNS